MDAVSHHAVFDWSSRESTAVWFAIFGVTVGSVVRGRRPRVRAPRGRSALCNDRPRDEAEPSVLVVGEGRQRWGVRVDADGDPFGGCLDVVQMGRSE
jgi:hypothetical protein